MELTPTTLILVGVICVVLGFFANGLLNTLRDDGETPAEDLDAAPPGGRRGRYNPVLRLWRERGKYGLVVEVDGRAFTSPEGLDAGQRQKLEAAARELRGWLGMGLSAAEPEPGPEVDLRRAVATPPANAAASAPANAAASAATSAPAQPAARPYATPAVSPAAVKAAPAPDPAATTTAGKSIVMQIEDILQDMIAGTELARNGLHLHEDPVRGVIVTVGATTYEGIDAVPESDAKTAIRAAVAEWEKAQ